MTCNTTLCEQTLHGEIKHLRTLLFRWMDEEDFIHIELPNSLAGRDCDHSKLVEDTISELIWLEELMPHEEGKYDNEE